MLLIALAQLLAATPAPKPSAAVAQAASPQEIELLLSSVQPAQRNPLQVSTHGLGTLPLYRVVVLIDPETRAFHGEEQIRVPLTASTPELVLRVFNNARYLNGGKPQVSVAKLSCPAQACTLVQDVEPTVVRVVFDPPLPAGGVAAMDLGFDGEVPALPEAALNAQSQMTAQVGLLQTHGGGPTDHGAFGAGLGVLSLTGLFPQLAAHFGGVVDTASPTGVGDVASYDTSNYLFTAEVPSSLTVVAGGKRIGEEATPSGGKRFTFAAAAVRDFPVYAGSWKQTSENAGGVKVSAYTLAGDEANGKIALGVASRALADFSKRFGAYPWSDFSVVEQPLADGAGGIEYPTVVGVASLVYRTQQSLGPLAGFFGPQQKLGSHETNAGIADKMLEFTVAHEVAHQWWSSLVGSDPHQHPAVDEALAQYSAALYIESKRGKAAATEALSTQVAMNFQMMRQSNEDDGAVDRPTDAFASPLQYAGLVYGKAPMFFPAARKLLGESLFAQALHRYAEKYRFGEAGPADFLLAATEVAPANARALQKLHTHWFEESHGDADIGPLDLGKLMESATGMKMSAEEKAAMQQLMPQMMQMLQNGVDPSQLAPDPSQSP